MVEAGKSCSRCRRRTTQGREARKFLRTHFPKTKVLTAEDPGCPILGMAALRSFGAHVFEGKKLARSVVARPRKPVSFQLEAAAWPELARH